MSKENEKRWQEISENGQTENLLFGLIIHSAPCFLLLLFLPHRISRNHKNTHRQFYILSGISNSLLCLCFTSCALCVSIDCPTENFDLRTHHSSLITHYSFPGLTLPAQLTSLNISPQIHLILLHADPWQRSYRHHPPKKFEGWQ